MSAWLLPVILQSGLDKYSEEDSPCQRHLPFEAGHFWLLRKANGTPTAATTTCYASTE